MTKSKDKKKTIEHMKKAVELNPRNASALNYLGYTYAEMGVRLQEAEELILKALKIAPNDGYYIDSLGWVYYQKGNYPKAVVELERALSLVIDDPVVMEHLGDAYEKAGRLEEALRQYHRALKKSKEEEQAQRVREKIERLESKI